MKPRNMNKWFSMLSLVAVILACALPASNNNATEVPATPSIQEATILPTTPPLTEAPIQHQLIPVGLPDDQYGHAGDYDSSKTADKRTAAGGDRFTFERIERPFNANTMDIYFPQLDIVNTTISQDDTWIYGSITLKGVDANKSLSGRYAMEIDVNVDGKGDWLIVAYNPASIDWSVTGVQIYQDVNDDVGGQLAMFTDKDNAPGGDGYEILVFDQGTGNDPDSAWARISANDPNTVEIAVKLSTLGNPDKYLIGMWAGNLQLDPSLFDLNDHFTHEQAGAADIGLESFYPIKGVSELDGSCRMAVGFQATGQEPGLCEEYKPQVPTGPTACVRPSDCYGCTSIWDPIKCICTHVVC